MAVAILVSFECRIGFEEQLEAAFAALADHTRREPGCIAYAPNRSCNEPLRYVLYECYEDLDAVERHRSMDYFEEFVVKLIPNYIENKSVEQYVPLSRNGENHIAK